MHRANLASPKDFDCWRDVARPLALAGVSPNSIEWSTGPAEAEPFSAPEGQLSVPRQFIELARDAIGHDDPERFVLLYALLLRVIADRSAIADRNDPLLRRVETLAREARMARLTGSSNTMTAWEALREEAKVCTRCPLYRNATQTVFGEGPVDARMMLVGEQPGDQEDVQGRPFVGPAGQLLDKALERAGIDRTRVYISNAVKHFKFTPRGGRRIHEKPDGREIQACSWWIEQERALIRPAVIVALGATAAQALLGRVVTISRTRGTPIPLEGGSAAHVTVHPSFLLRVDDPERKKEEYRRFVEDLVRANEAVRTAA